MRKRSNPRLVQYVLTTAFALFCWGAKRLWKILTSWISERKKPVPDRQKVDRQKAFAGLLAIAAAAAAFAYFIWKGFIAAVSASAAFLDRQTALYAGGILLIIGLRIVRRMPKRRRIGLVLAAVGALLVAYGLGYLG